MGVLSGMEPERVFYYFEEICKIPHGSYHEKAISDYLVKFAKEHNITAYQDALYNIIMLLQASEGYEQEEPLILQGHMDMVCEKKEGSGIDMEKEGLSIAVEGDYVYAKDTTLGGDDGIAVAYMLAIAENPDIPHPPLELVITVSEEVGMEGAAGIDLSVLKGHRMLNLDSEEEGIFLSSCAGGLTTCSVLPVVRQESPEVFWYELTVSGLLGGHSGCEIDKGRANANKVLGRVLYELQKRCGYYLYSLEGGKKDNAIPLYAAAVIGFEDGQYDEISVIIERLNSELKTEYSQSDRGIEVSLCKKTREDRKSSGAGDQYCKMEVDGESSDTVDKCRKMAVDEKSLSKIITLLMILPDGVQDMSMSVEGLVETSLNLGIMSLEAERLYLQHSIRSSVSTKKQYVASRIERLMLEMGGSTEIKGEYPAWEYKEDSVVRPKAVALYERMYGKTPMVVGIHAGLECGLLAGKIEDLDCIAMGPDILDIHTTTERLSISSTKRVYEFLLEYLKQKDGE